MNGIAKESTVTIELQELVMIAEKMLTKSRRMVEYVCGEVQNEPMEHTAPYSLPSALHGQCCILHEVLDNMTRVEETLGYTDGPVCSM